MRLPQPRLVAHADWSISPGKRWLCIAERASDGGYHIAAPTPVGAPGELPRVLLDRAGQESVLLGVDFPLGLPMAYARLAGVTSFADLLPKLGYDEWTEFFELCDVAEDISLTRPFYPRRRNSSRRSASTTWMNCGDAASERLNDAAPQRRCSGRWAHSRSDGQPSAAGATCCRSHSMTTPSISASGRSREASPTC